MLEKLNSKVSTSNLTPPNSLSFHIRVTDNTYVLFFNKIILFLL